MTNRGPEIRYDPYDYAIDADPHATWRRMRDEAPLYRNDEYDFYALSRFNDVFEANLDHQTYSSARGTVLEMIGTMVGESPMMIFQDPPRHTQLRKLVSHAFSPRRIGALEPQIRAIAAGYLDRFTDTDGFDYVADFGAKLPMMVIGAMLGVPEADREDIREATDLMLHREPGQTDQAEHHQKVTMQVFDYFARYVAERRKQPRDDMMTDLLRAEIDEDGEKRRLTDEELLAFIGLLSGAGNETVARFLGWTGSILARFPDERAKLVADRTKIPNAVEEILRYEAPSPVQARYVTRDTAWHDTAVPAGSKVLLLTGSAGRDERVFDDPDRFDVDRPIERHLTFGYGVHFCLGASLARLEARVAIEETLARFPTWEVDWENSEMVHTSTVRGYAKLPIRTQ